jgi:uncharacterized repeat protein (TIGR03803 family)
LPIRLQIAMICAALQKQIGWDNMFCSFLPPETSIGLCTPDHNPEGDIPMNRKRNLFPMKQPLALFVAIVVLAGSVLAVGQTENVVYRFKGGSDGLEPLGGLTSDNAGNFYGTTCGDGSSNKGTVFQLAPRGRHWTETVLYDFASTNDGSCPFGELIFDQAGNVYGTATSGTGLSSTVFELKPPAAQGSPWTESVIYTFEASAELYDGLVFDKAGNLYGSTYAGGEKGRGQVFQLTPSQGGGWSETVIHSFTGGADGSTPLSGPIIDRSGNLFGLIQQGPSENYNGAVYELKAPSPQGGVWTERVLYSFKGGNDAAGPTGRLVLDQKGNLDGVTLSGGGASNRGTVFQVTRQRGSWIEAVLYSFCAQSNCADGGGPEASLILDGKGNLYGTTLNGGTGGNCGSSSGCGTVFELTPPTQGGTWTETVLHNFTGSGGDGSLPRAGLIRGKFDLLWGTTPAGGWLAQPCTFINGCGTVFNVRP